MLIRPATVRDEQNHLPLNGICIGDIGPKAHGAMAGLDNGCKLCVIRDSCDTIDMLHRHSFQSCASTPQRNAVAIRPAISQWHL